MPDTPAATPAPETLVSTVEPAPGPERRTAGDALDALFGAALVTGVLLRVLVAADPVLGRLNSDQAVDYLQARQVLDGEYQAYFWGQQYAGSLLPTLLGWVFAVTGPRLWLLPASIVLASALCAFLTRQVGLALGHRRAGNVAGSLMAVGPPSWLYLGSVSASFYSVGLALSLGALLLVVRRDVPRLRDGLAVGVLSGLALWTSPVSVLTLLPVALLGALRYARRPAATGAAVLGGLLGLLPVLLSALGRGQLTQDRFSNPGTAGERVERAVTGTWAAVLTRFAPEQAPPWLLDRVASTALLLAFAAAAVLLGRVLLDGDRGPALALLVPTLLLVPFCALLRLPTDAPSARYAIPVLPLLLLAAGALARREQGARGAGRRVPGSPTTAVTAVALLAVFSATGLWQASSGRLGGPDPLHAASYQALERALLERGRTAVRADYWIAYRLAAETDERVVADAPSMTRYPPYARAAAEAPRSTTVVFAGNPSDAAIQAFLARPGAPTGVERLQVAHFAVYLADRQLTGADVLPVLPTFDQDDPP